MVSPIPLTSHSSDTDARSRSRNPPKCDSIVRARSTAFFFAAAFFSIVLHNLWHAIVIFAIGGLGVFLIAKDWFSNIFRIR